MDLDGPQLFHFTNRPIVFRKEDKYVYLYSKKKKYVYLWTSRSLLMLKKNQGLSSQIETVKGTGWKLFQFPTWFFSTNRAESWHICMASAFKHLTFSLQLLSSWPFQQCFQLVSYSHRLIAAASQAPRSQPVTLHAALDKKGLATTCRLTCCGLRSV